MSTYQQKKIWKIIKYSKLTGILFLLLVIYFSIESLQFLSKWSQLDKKLDDAKKERDIINSKLEKRQNEYDFLNTERGQEEYLRNNMPVARDNEKVVILYDPTSSAVQVLSTEIPTYLKVFKRIQYLFATYTNF
jgi:hypothetical protein